MREISVRLDKDAYAPGDRIEGTVVISCDEMFDCNSVNLRFTGEERSRIVRSSGKYSRVYTEELELFNHFLELQGGSVIQEGETRHDFAFEVPQNAMSSFEGAHGFIKYQIEAKVEVSWALDPKTTVEVSVVAEAPLLMPTSLRENLMDNDKKLLEVEVHTDVVSLGQPIRLEIRLIDDFSFRGLRCEIIHHERVSPEGKEEYYRAELTEWYSEEFRVPRHVPIDIEMKTSDSWPPAFQSELITCVYILKVTLDVAWRLDKVIEIPLRFGRTKQGDDPFISPGMDF